MLQLGQSAYIDDTELPSDAATEGDPGRTQQANHNERANSNGFRGAIGNNGAREEESSSE
jgi:hypothetical protein